MLCETKEWSSSDILNAINFINETTSSKNAAYKIGYEKYCIKKGTYSTHIADSLYTNEKNRYKKTTNQK